MRLALIEIPALAPARVDVAKEARPPAPVAADPAGSASVATAAQNLPTPADPKSIAVLAFANMSADKDTEYFSDGVAEEILNALAKIEDLKVAGRTSSFYFKGRNEPLAAIGSTLGVAHVLEGSVRKQGERLRISAKLLRVSDGLDALRHARTRCLGSTPRKFAPAHGLRSRQVLP